MYTTIPTTTGYPKTPTDRETENVEKKDKESDPVELSEEKFKRPNKKMFEFRH